MAADDNPWYGTGYSQQEYTQWYNQNHDKDGALIRTQGTVMDPKKEYVNSPATFRAAQDAILQHRDDEFRAIVNNLVEDQKTSFNERAAINSGTEGEWTTDVNEIMAGKDNSGHTFDEWGQILDEEYSTVSKMYGNIDPEYWANEDANLVAARNAWQQANRGVTGSSHQDMLAQYFNNPERLAQDPYSNQAFSTWVAQYNNRANSDYVMRVNKERAEAVATNTERLDAFMRGVGQKKEAATMMINRTKNKGRKGSSLLINKNEENPGSTLGGISK